MNKYFVTVSLDVEAQSPAQAAMIAHHKLSHLRADDARIRVYNPPEREPGKDMKITSTLWTYAGSPVEIVPIPPDATAPAPKPAKEPAAKAEVFEDSPVVLPVATEPEESVL